MNQQDLDNERAEFEVWARAEALANDPNEMQLMWRAWQAARARSAAESTKPESLASLRGMAKGARGGSTSEELVERARGDWNSELAASAKELMEAAQCASNILFLLTAEVKALGLRADKVKEKLDAAIQAAKAQGDTP